jgi:hypothetical protein
LLDQHGSIEVAAEVETRTPHDTPSYPLTPSPTFDHSSLRSPVKSGLPWD